MTINFPLLSSSYSAKIARQSKTNFYYSFFFLPALKRRAMFSIYAFCRLIDDIVDEEGVRAEKAARLRAWREEIRNCYAGKPSHPVTIEIAQILPRFPIPQHYFEELIRGVEMDLEKTRYATFDELVQYCYRVASVVGLMCIEIFGYTNKQTQEYAINLGLALQLTNILRDLKTDAQRGRIYLPQVELMHFGYSEGELLQNVYNEAFIHLMRFQTQRAKAYFHKAQTLLPPEDRAALCPAEIMGNIYARLLQHIEDKGYQVFQERITLPNRTKIGIALKTWLQPRIKALRPF
ncbi:MAG: squalene synthase HpnD [Nitrospinota bacterium]|nr:MAG: squalene synthase HpnD [Nitrospinota bacterium]